MAATLPLRSPLSPPQFGDVLPRAILGVEGTGLMHARAIRLGFLAAALIHAGCFGDDKKNNGPTGMNAPDGGSAGSAGAGGTGASGTGGTAAGTGAGAGGMSGGGTGGTGAGTMAPPPGQDGAAFAMVVPMYAQAYCDVLTRCLPPAIADLVFGGADCESSVLASLEDGESMDLQNAVDAGRVIYDPTKVDTCFEMLSTLECTMQASSVLEQGACGEILTGTVAAGGDCGLSAECLGATFCDRTAGCPGVCTPQRGAGETCSDDDECAEPTSCDGETKKCATAGQADDTCGGGVAPDCGLGFMCVGDDADTMTAGTCKAIDEVFAAAEGAACDFDTGQLCVDGLSCVVTITGMGAGATTEFACAPKVAAGAACGFAIPPQCPSGEYCDGTDPMAGDVEGTCTALPGDGEACVPQYGAPCAGDLVCDTDGLCHPLGRIGDKCVSGAGCASGRCVSGTCQRPPKCEVR